MAVYKYTTANGEPRWRICLTVKGQRIHRRGFLTKKDAKEAEIMAKETASSFNPEPPLPQESNGGLRQLVVEYLEFCDLRMAPNTMRQKDFVFSRFLARLPEGVEATHVTASQVSDYLSEAKIQRGNAAANRDLREIKALFNWGKRLGNITQNPAAPLDRFPEKPFLKYVPPTEDVEKVLNCADPEMRDLLEILIYTVARRGEILQHLKWSDIDFKNGTVRLQTKKARRGDIKYQLKPMSPKLRNILERRLRDRQANTPYVFPREDGTPRKADDFKHRMFWICKQAGVKSFGFHSLRHYAASVLVEAGSPLTLIQFFMGHERPTTTDNYLRSLPKGLQEAAALLDRSTP